MKVAASLYMLLLSLFVNHRSLSAFRFTTILRLDTDTVHAISEYNQAELTMIEEARGVWNHELLS